MNKKDKIRKFFSIIALMVFVCSISYMTYTLVDEYINNKSFKDITISSVDSSNDWSKVKEKYPNITFPKGMQIKWAETYAENTDFVAYLRIPNTTVSTPITQSNDNKYYLRHNFKKGYSRYGCAFLDCNDSINPLDNTIWIYGHNMKNNKLFGELPSIYSNYPSSEYRTMSFSTLYNDYDCSLYAAFYTKGLNNNQQKAYQTLKRGYTNEQEFEDYVEAVNVLNIYHDKTSVKYGDKIISLYTCSYNHYEERFIVLFTAVEK